MKRKFVSLLLVLLFVFSPASAAFSDISDSKLAQTASVLDALGIMQGVGDNRFDPGSSLTRAQFCKLAVTALGFSDVSAYGSYTIFPDVKNTHWAAQYINAAVRHPDLKDQAIIRGYADGTFGPDKIVNYGEVCTMLLRMLGYKEADIGPFWPADYIARAQSLGLTKDVSLTDPNAAVKRSDAAIMLVNTLGASMKGEEGGLLLDRVASATVKDSILLETSETDSSLADNEAIFYEGGSLNEAPRKTAGTLDKSLIGVYGTIVVGKEGEKVAVGVIPNNNKVETHTVTEVSADSVQTDQQTLHPNRDTKVYVSREGRKLGTFAEMWSGIQAGDSLHCYYNEYGVLELMAVLPRVSSSAGNSFVYGIASSANIPAEYQIVKNGTVVDRTKLKKYDVVTLDAANKQALVSDVKISGQYLSGTPTFSYPQTVTMFGKNYSISDQAAATFASIKLNDYITLLFDTEGNVTAAYPTTAVRADMQGIVTNVKDNTTATVALFNGLTLQDLSVDADELGSMLGRVVVVGQASGGKASLSTRTLSGKVSGTWSIADGKLGDRKVSSKVKIYEEVLSGAPLNAIKASDITTTTVESGQIRYTVMDSAGTITNIVLGDVTGESWIYGIAGGESHENEGYETNFVKLKYWNGTAGAEATYRVLSLPGALNNTPVGVPMGYSTSENVVNTSLATRKLNLVDTVDLSAFDGSSGVRTKDGYYALASDIGVYISARNEFISLQNAKSNYTSFRLYANKSAEEGGKVRLIIAS